MSTKIFDSLFAKNNAEAIEFANDALQSKAYELIQQRKITVAQNLFNQEVSEEDE
jgi:hypothetical protein